MQSAMFTGNVAKTPVLSGSSEHAVCKFTLISNEYAGKDEDGKAKERQVSIFFTAFRGKAETIAKHVRKGDQLIVTYRIENNHYQKDGEDVYGYNFLVEDFAFGAPGKEKREQMAA
jgi:single-strand DNA-binding protein